MTQTFAMAASALRVRDIAPLFTDTNTYLRMNGAQIETKIGLGTRYYLMATVTITDSAGSGWTSSLDTILAATNDGYAEVAPTLVTAPSIVGTRKIGCTLMCIGGRADGWPSPYWTYQWTRDAAVIDGATRWVYTQTASDLGAVIECWVTWKNAHATPLDSITTGGAATAAADVTAPGASVRYIGPTAAGAADGSSWANRFAFTSLNRAIAEAGAAGAGEVLIAADLGTYNFTGTQTISAGGLNEAGRVTIRGVNSVTGADEKATFAGGRAAFDDVGRYMTRTGGSGRQLIQFVPITDTFTAAVSNVITMVADGPWRALRENDEVNVSSTGTLPAPLAAGTTYFVLKQVATRTIKLSLTSGGAEIDITDAGSGTHTISVREYHSEFTPNVDDTLTVSAGFYAETFTGDVVKVTTTDTLPAGLAIGSGASPVFYLVKKISANVIKLAVNTTHLYDEQYVDITDVGVGTHTIWTHQRRQNGPKYITFKHLNVNNAGSTSGAIGLGTVTRALAFTDIDVYNVYRFLNNVNYSGATTGQNASQIGLAVTRCHALGTERGFWRLAFASWSCTATDCSCDSARYSKDSFPSLFALESTNITSNCFVGCSYCTYTRVQAQRAYYDAGSGQYWNGDGFEDNQASLVNTYANCESAWNSDGGYDCKGIGDVFTDCLAAFCKRNYRLWGYDVTLTDCWSMQTQRAGEAFGENGGSAHFWQGRDNASCTINQPVIREGGSTVVFYLDNSFADLTMVVNQPDFLSRTGTVVTSAYTHDVAPDTTLTINT